MNKLQFRNAQFRIRPQSWRLVSIVVLLCCLSLTLPGQEATGTSDIEVSNYTLRIDSDMVLVNLTAHDSKGQPITDLNPNDLAVYEDGKPQRIISLDKEDCSLAPIAATTTVANDAISLNVLSSPARLPKGFVSHNSRFLVLYFDASSLEPIDLQRAAESSINYVKTRMTASDVVAVLVYSTRLSVLQDFTNDRKALIASLQQLNATKADSATTSRGTTALSREGEFTVSSEQSQSKIFAIDMRLRSIASVARALGVLREHKSLIYFSGGLSKSGIDNQAELRATINAAVRSNVALYTLDVRGLKPLPPGGSADRRSATGTTPYSGVVAQQDRDEWAASQETLVTLSNDTGGRAILNQNELGGVFSAIQHDDATYYILGYRSTNRGMDGSYRHIKVQSKTHGVVLQYRPGYYGPRNWTHLGTLDRQKRLEEEMNAELTVPDFPISVTSQYFRATKNSYHVAISVVVPGFALASINTGNEQMLPLDFYGQARDARTKNVVAAVRNTIRYPIDKAEQGQPKNLQYQTSFVVPPGEYTLKFLVSDPKTGNRGSFETNLLLPNLKTAASRISSVLLSSQLNHDPHPQNILPFVPNPTRIFAAGQIVHLYYELYPESEMQEFPVTNTVELYQNEKLVYRGEPVITASVNDPYRGAATLDFELPTTGLPPDQYTCRGVVFAKSGQMIANFTETFLIRKR